MAKNPTGRTKSRGRSNIQAAKMTTRANLPVSQRTQASRPVSAGGGVKRGDRRDTSKTFTNSNRHQPNLSNPRGSGKAQTQAGGKARSGGGKREKGTYDH